MIASCLRHLPVKRISTFVALTLLAVAPVSAATGSVETLQLSLAGEQAGDVEGQRHAQAEELTAKPEASAEVYKLGPGDRLRITFYDRDDLSGEVGVRSDGRISLPFFGAIPAEGKTIAELEADIGDAFYEATQQSAFINIEVVAWRPFYVVGYVNRPGAYPFAPGIAVLHAVATAGGVFREANATVVETSREIWRRQEARDDLQRALARVARLEAERDGLESIDVPDELVRLAGREEAERLMAAERHIFEYRRTALKQRLDDLANIESLAQDEIAAQKMQLESMREEETLRRSELAETERLAEVGLMRRNVLYDTKYALSTLMGNASRVIAQIAAAERTLAEVKRDRTAAKITTWEAAQTEITAVENEIASLRHTIVASGDAIQLMQGAQSADPAVNYQIMRWQDGAYKVTPADAATRLLPGDALSVGVTRTLPTPTPTGEGERVPTGDNRNDDVPPNQRTGGHAQTYGPSLQERN